MQKILVTGANGFVGYYLVKKLLEKNYNILATGKGKCRLPFSNKTFRYVSMDFTDREQIQITMVDYIPDVVIQAGAMSGADECEQNREGAFLTNVTGTIYLLDAAAASKAFFIFLSTDFVFSGDKGMYTEDDVRAPVNYYGQTKMLAEDEVMKYAGQGAVVRTVLVYGKPILSRQNLLTNTATALKNGLGLRIFNDQLRTPTWVEDLANGVISILEKKAIGIYHIAGKDKLSPYEAAVAVADYLSLDASLIEKITEGDMIQVARRPLRTGFDISKARHDLKFEPVSFTEGLRKTFE